jgi:retron-type reverse transcriptase
MDKVILKKLLKSGYVEEGVTHLTELGTPQGGIISPTLAVMALSGYVIIIIYIRLLCIILSREL